MAFGINKNELKVWKRRVKSGEIAFLTHYWYDKRFPQFYTVTKVGCSDLEKLYRWGDQYGLLATYVDLHPLYPHFDLFGEKQLEILIYEQQWDQIRRFELDKLKKRSMGV